MVAMDDSSSMADNHTKQVICEIFEPLNSDSIPDRVKPQTMKSGIHSLAFSDKRNRVNLGPFAVFLPRQFGGL